LWLAFLVIDKVVSVLNDVGAVLLKGMVMIRPAAELPLSSQISAESKVPLEWMP
jgi:hypothetical protein